MSIEGGALIAAPVVLPGAAIGLLAVGGVVVLAGAGIAMYHLTRGAIAGTAMLAQAGYVATQANFRQIRHAVQQQSAIESGITQLYTQALNTQYQKRADARTQLEEHISQMAQKRADTLNEIRSVLRSVQTPISTYIPHNTNTSLDVSAAVRASSHSTDQQIYSAYDVSKMVQMYQQVLVKLHHAYSQLTPIINCDVELKDIEANQKLLAQPATTITSLVIVKVARKIRHLESHLSLIQQKIYNSRELAQKFERVIDDLTQDLHALPNDPSGMIQYLLQTITAAVQRQQFDHAEQLIITLKQEIEQLKKSTHISLLTMFRHQFQRLRQDLTNFSTLDYAPKEIQDWLVNVNQIEDKIRNENSTYSDVQQTMERYLKTGQQYREHMVQAIALRNQATIIGVIAHELTEMGYPPDGDIDAQKVCIGRNGSKTVSISVNEHGELHFGSRGFGDGSCRSVYDDLMHRLSSKYGFVIHGDAYWTQKRTVDALIHSMIQQRMQVDVRIEHNSIIITAVNNSAVSAVVNSDGHATFSDQFTQYVQNASQVVETTTNSVDSTLQYAEQQRIRLHHE
jgi:hypothetical protein